MLVLPAFLAIRRLGGYVRGDMLGFRRFQGLHVEASLALELLAMQPSFVPAGCHDWAA